jgi:ATP-binding cassette, subfamily C, bacterial exporter for protease/lipase
VIQPLVQIVMQWRSFVQARDSMARLESLLSAVPAKQQSMALPAPRGRLQAENLLVLAPGTQVPLLRNVNFGANPGEAVAVIGASASGKTTLARALAGLWPSMGGKARLDGVDIHAWDKSELGPHVGYLPQGIELFDGTIADNIARFGEVDVRKVETAARAVGVHEFILSLPNGYDTDVGPEGARLSGGQRQRVGLARALYGDPVFVVLDEPNSNLDEAGEAALLAAIRDGKERGTTFVVVTHRTGLLQIADRILLLRDGVQQMFGSRDEVLGALHKANQEAAARANAATNKTQGAPGQAAPELAA